LNSSAARRYVASAAEWWLACTLRAALGREPCQTCDNGPDPVSWMKTGEARLLGDRTGRSERGCSKEDREVSWIYKGDGSDAAGLQMLAKRMSEEDAVIAAAGGPPTEWGKGDG
jgi:hypothetical protein